MTREELHELVDIVMDAREEGIMAEIDVRKNSVRAWVYIHFIDSLDYPTFSDFTQAVKDYIKSLG